MLNKIKNTYIFHIDISVINFSLIFELNKYSNLGAKINIGNSQANNTLIYNCQSLKNGLYIIYSYYPGVFNLGFFIKSDNEIRIQNFEFAFLEINKWELTLNCRSWYSEVFAYKIL